MTEQLAREKLEAATQWWQTGIIDVHPGEISVRGYRLSELIGQISFIDMIWLMLRGDLPRPGEAALLEAALVASVDHGPQAPAISIARMATTCGVSINGAMASAINALDDYHGGSGQLCMALYAQINAEAGRDGDLVDAAITVIQASISAGNPSIPGFGHRFHPVDPRVVPLLDLAGNAVAAGTIPGRYTAIARATEAALGIIKQRYIAMNIEGMTAAIYCELGFSPELGRGLFVLSRSVGILAHAWEQKQQGDRGKGPMPKTIPYTYTGQSYRPVPEKRASRRTAEAI